MKKFIYMFLMMIMIGLSVNINAKSYTGVSKELLDDYMVCDSIRTIIPHTFDTGKFYDTTHWIFGLNATRNINTNQTNYTLVVELSSLNDKSNNTTLLIRTFDNEVIELTARDENEKVINLPGKVTKGLLEDVNILKSINNHVNTVYFDIKEEDIVKLRKGIRKVRIGTDSSYNEKTFLKDKAGKKLYEIYLNFNKWFSEPIHVRQIDEDF